MRKPAYLAVIALMIGAATPSNAQSISYADALGRLGQSCGQDIAKHCKTVNLGGGRMTRCLEQNSAGISAGCKTSIANMKALLASRSQARASVMKICDADIRRLCPGVQPGDGNLLECFHKASRNTSAACRKTVADAGYDATVNPNAPTSQVALSSADLVNSLQNAEESARTVTAASLRQMAAASLKDPLRTNRMNRAPLSGQLEKQAQITIAIQFDLNSARIRPDSFQAVGLMADSLYHPYLQGYKFLVVGNTDATGSREYNLKLSQQRADAIREALINPFGIAPARIEAVGLGEEQLLKPAEPASAENRRVQLINIGPMR
jgi:outer membrane protein OmpA-like peptidoglycan-associated protein